MALDALRRADPSLRTRTLPVDLVEAPRRLHDAVRRLSPKAILLLGEAGDATRIRLETRAWNQLDFTLPDIVGRQPRDRPIDPAATAFLDTVVPAEQLAQLLRSSGHDADLSTDPGRYLCNRIFHAALHRHAIPSIFIHLPLESVLSTDRAAAALQIVIAHLDGSDR